MRELSISPQINGNIPSDPSDLESYVKIYDDEVQVYSYVL